MRWKNRRRSTNFEDRRGQGVRKGATVGVGGIVMALIAIFFFNQDPSTVMQGVQQQGSSQTGPYQGSAQEEQVIDFLKVVQADTEDTWSKIFEMAGGRYSPPTFVVFTNATQTACGTGQAASGPFYCPADQQIYMDLSFLAELKRMGASGDFAAAYVFAHEVGHHIQTITGTSNQVRQRQAKSSKTQGNALQVLMELQADCYAGVWANHTQKRTQFLQRGDLEEAMQAAASVGDDKIMRDAGIPPRREAFTHGSSKERMQWFKTGAQTGDISACNTFR